MTGLPVGALYEERRPRVHLPLRLQARDAPQHLHNKCGMIGDLIITYLHVFIWQYSLLISYFAKQIEGNSDEKNSFNESTIFVIIL